MTEGWGMVVAAAIALSGVLCGLFIGRRQVRDQAQVEHGQWLRGQRQEAFVHFLTVWDETVPKFESRVLSEEESIYLDRMDGWDEAGTFTVEAMETDRKPLRQAAERVQMLGPETVETAVNAMLDTIAKMALGIGGQYAVGPQDDNLHDYWESMGEVEPKRAAFVAASRSALRQTPDTART
ncbi:hypothetical protein ACGFU4_32115 [Streptomyces sp. NPDC048511]|uniref:hypothetical protein n=1 Tax=Streptomyces sp. NPDC048511 TaxID=3365562 RepID=UPI00371D851B